MTTAAPARDIADFPYWYHRIDLGGGRVTPGFSPTFPEAYGVPDDMTGLTVLDVGAWDGYWTFEALKRGAKHVLAIDDFSDYCGDKAVTCRNWDTFDYCREALGYSRGQCQRFELSVYDIADRDYRFDAVFAFGLLYHLRHPLLALDKLRAVCDGTIYVESAICDDYSPYRGGFGGGYPGGQMVAEFYPGKEYGNNESNWWVPTLSCLEGMVRSAGFTRTESWKLEGPGNVAACRGFVIGRV